MGTTSTNMSPFMDKQIMDLNLSHGSPAPSTNDFIDLLKLPRHHQQQVLEDDGDEQQHEEIDSSFTHNNGIESDDIVPSYAFQPISSLPDFSPKNPNLIPPIPPNMLSPEAISSSLRFFNSSLAANRVLATRNQEDLDADLEDGDLHVDEEATEHEVQGRKKKSSQKVITTAMVDLWLKSIKENGSLNAVRSLMKAFRAACHYGDDEENEYMEKLSVMSSDVFNKIMFIILNEMDGILRKLLKIPAIGGRKQMVTDLMTTKQWRIYGHIVKSYLGNAFHILNQMNDSHMISFTLHRLKYSSVLLAAFPSLPRKYIKVYLHFWGTGGGALPVVSCLFMRELFICIGCGCIYDCFKGNYKAYVLNCHFVNAVKLKHIRFLSNCDIELLGVDLPNAYQRAFIFIRQLAMILRDTLNTKNKEAFRKVYEWKFINCLELWTDAIRAYGSQSDFKQLAYQLTQIIFGLARLITIARYISLRLRCISMLNQLAACIQSFVPVSMLLLDMLEMEKSSRPPTGGVGKAVDLRNILKVSKPTLKTRAFQEVCVFSVVEELAEHLALWSNSFPFMELPFIPIVRLRRFCKLTKVERFRREMRQVQKNRMMEDEVKLYEHVMDSSYKSSVSDCVILLKSISGSDKPDKITYCQIIFGLCKTRRFEEAHKVIEEMQACDCRSDINTWTVLIQGYCDAGELDNAFLSLYKMMETIISCKGHQNSNLFTTNLDCHLLQGHLLMNPIIFPNVNRFLLQIQSLLLVMNLIIPI
ncbi:nucleolar complex-associated protein 2-like [Vicia villosa]|uniref:nucleolar complex-associated protein 2-like n=1 Tax=Vicia villosa TaxID=3911 RepID=UPI00273C4C12|nr:nucleolar complex-associated protein 2-like [Vicia villosa]